MNDAKSEKKWERTNVTNLLRNRESGTYYARVKVNGKQKWRTLQTTLFSVAKLRLADSEREIREQGKAVAGDSDTVGANDLSVGRYVGIYRARTQDDPSLAPGTRERRESAIKAVLKTWPDLAGRDVRKVHPADCRTWAAKALREGTGFVAPNAKTKRRGMSASSFNKTVDTLRAIFDIAREQGVIYRNPASEVAKAPMKGKRLVLPSAAQFQAIIKSIASAGAKWSTDCADLTRLLAFSGMRLREATALRWSDVDSSKKLVSVPGTKTKSSRRIIPIFPALGALFDEMHVRRGEEGPEAKVARVSRCLGALESACEALGVARINHHDLRHLFATRCIESGVDIPTVSRWLGHSDGGALAMKTYGHLRQEHSQAQAAKVSF